MYQGKCEFVMRVNPPPKKKIVMYKILKLGQLSQNTDRAWLFWKIVVINSIAILSYNNLPFILMAHHFAMNCNKYYIYTGILIITVI